MKKKILILLGLVVIVFVVLAVFVFPKTTPPILSEVITSEDGNVSLTIPSEALPKHIELSDISIKEVESQNFPLMLDDESALAIYDLQPGGLYFLEPIAFSIDLPLEDDVIPALYNVSEYGVSRMNNAEITIDSTKKTANIAGTTEHFSYFYVSTDGFSMTLTSPKEAIVGQAVQASGTTTLIRKASKWIMADSREAHKNPFQEALFRQWKEAANIGAMTGNVEVGELKYKEPWHVQGKMTANPAGIVAPNSIDEAPAKKAVTGTTYTFNGAFTCKSPGLATFDYTVNISAEMEMEWKINPPFDISMEFPKKPITIRQISHTECKAVPVGEEGIGGGGVGGGGNGEEGGDGDQEGDEEDGGESEEDDDSDEEESEHEGLKDADKECPDCDGLEEQLEDLEDKKAELEDQIEDKKDELKDAEFTEELLDADLDALIQDAGCDPKQGLAEGPMPSGASSGKVSSRARDFYCPTQAAAEALVDALKEFWKTHKSPSQVRHELRQLQKKLDKINLDIEGVKKALEDCPCVAIHVPPALIDLDGKELVLTPEIKLEEWIRVAECEEKVEELDLKAGSDESDSFKVSGDFPDWIDFSPNSGTFPQKVDVNVDCDKVQNLEAGEHSVTGEIEILNKEKKKVRGIPVNMIFGIMLVEGEEEEPEVSTGGAVVMGPPFIEFVYDHANPSCPLGIEPLQISGPVGGEWVVVTPPPTWLRLEQTSGTIPGSIDMNFPCRLDRYENQEQTQTFTVEVMTTDGTKDQFTYTVKGKFTNF